MRRHILFAILGALATTGFLRGQETKANEGRELNGRILHALGTVHGVDMAALRDIGREEHVKTILLDILDPKTGENLGIARLLATQSGSVSVCTVMS
jgi:hypothetical protein